MCRHYCSAHIPIVKTKHSNFSYRTDSDIPPSYYILLHTIELPLRSYRVDNPTQPNPTMTIMTNSDCVVAKANSIPYFPEDIKFTTMSMSMSMTNPARVAAEVNNMTYFYIHGINHPRYSHHAIISNTITMHHKKHLHLSYQH